MDKFLDEEQQRRLFEALRFDSRPVARRDGAAIRLLISTGMRIGECLQLTVGDAAAALKTKYLFIPKEYRKGREGERRDHEVLVTEPVRLALWQLLALRIGAELSEALIVSRKSGGKAMTVRAFELRVDYWAKVAGLPGVTPHWFRHTRGMNIMTRTTSNDPLGVVKAALGHTSIRSTEVYARAARANVEAALHEVDGPPRLRLKDLRKLHEGRAGV